MDIAEFENRLLDAIESLTFIREDKMEKGKNDQYQWEEYIRVTGKIEGIKLALSYLNDMKGGCFHD